MNFFSVPLQSQSDQPLSSDRLMTARGLTNLVMTDNELSVRWLTWLGATWRDCSVDGFQQFSLYKQQFD